METDQPSPVEPKRFTFTLRQLLMVVALAAILAGFVVVWREEPEPTERWVTSLGFSPDGKRLAVGANCWGGKKPKRIQITAFFRVIALLDLEERKQFTLVRSRWSETIPSFLSLKEGRLVEFAPDGTILVAATIDGVKLWDAATMQVLQESVPYSGRGFARAIVFSPHGKRLAVAGTDIAVTPNGERLFLAEADTTVDIWDVSSGKVTVVKSGMVHVSDIVDVVEYSPDGNIFATAIPAPDSRIILCDASSARKVRAIDTSQPAIVESLKFSHDGKTLVTCERYWRLPSAVCCYSVTEGTKLLSFEAAAPCCVALSPDDRFLAVADEADGLTIWNVETKGSRKVGIETAGVTISVTYSPDGRKLATGDTQGNVTLWDAATLTPLDKFQVCGPGVPRSLKSIGLLVALIVWCVVWFRWCWGTRRTL
jgi:WD40 repeat protein